MDNNNLGLAKIDISLLQEKSLKLAKEINKILTPDFDNVEDLKSSVEKVRKMINEFYSDSYILDLDLHNAMEEEEECAINSEDYDMFREINDSAKTQLKKDIYFND